MLQRKSGWITHKSGWITQRNKANDGKNNRFIKFSYALNHNETIIKSREVMQPSLDFLLYDYPPFVQRSSFYFISSSVSRRISGAIFSRSFFVT